MKRCWWQWWYQWGRVLGNKKLSIKKYTSKWYDSDHDYACMDNETRHQIWDKIQINNHEKYIKQISN